jgi:cobalt-zinc-cadmium efflux system membrane fusion protein
MRHLLLILLLGAAGCSSQSHASEAPTPPAHEVWVSATQAEEARIATSAVDEHEVQGALVTSGKIAFDDLRVEHVFSPVAGRVTKIEAQLGERVKKGQALAVIDSPDLGLASADVAKAEADLAAAEHDHERQKQLLAIKAVAQRDYEQAEDNYRKAKAELERARQKALLLGRGGGVGQSFVLRAHIDGEVIGRALSPGMEVQGQYSGGGAVELFTIGDASRVWALADAFEMDIPRVKPGEKVGVKVVAYPDKVFEGTVDWISTALDPATRTAKVRCTIENPEKLLKPEMFATVTITAPGKQRLAVPRNAVLHLGEQTLVFVPTGETPEKKLRFERRPVAVDEQEAGEWVPILRGLAKGESVVTSGAILLSGS